MDWVSSAEIRHISKLPKSKGQCLLGRQLRLNISDLDEDLRSGALLDYYYDVMQFVVSRGMPWHEVANAMTFANDFFRSFIHLTLPKSLCALRELSTQYVEQQKLGIENMKKLAQYFTVHVLAHHSLFQFVFSRERDCKSKHMSLEVQVSDAPKELSLSKTLKLWEYENRVQKVKSEENRKQMELNKERDLAKEKTQAVEKEIEHQLAKKEEVGEVDVKSMTEFLSALTAEEVNLVHDEVGFEIKKMKQAAEIAADLQAIPIPPELQNSTQKLPSKTQMKVKSSAGSRKSSGKGSPRKKK
uniref:Uncharacterized protein C8orf74 homolog n=1 Tax=Phallusia mammillata TaxID=59560 RepID=A0A6F9D8X1_9ASCI|nr:uncharacterized protein C8orf74 homolog [Phallusia mammillata]